MSMSYEDNADLVAWMRQIIFNEVTKNIKKSEWDLLYEKKPLEDPEWDG